MIEKESHDLKLWNKFASSLMKTRECWEDLQAYVRDRGGSEYTDEHVQKRLARCSWRSPFHKMIGRLVDYAMTSGGINNLLIIGKE